MPPASLIFRSIPCALGLLVTLFGVNGCDVSPSRSVPGPRITSYGHLAEIGRALRDYKEEHGDLPPRLSDLVPDQIPLDQIPLFYVKAKAAQDLALPPDWARNPKRIDQYSAYAYLGTNNVRGIIAFEKTNVWKATAPHAGQLAVLFSDFHVQYVRVADIQDAIAKSSRQGVNP
jgi:hypothetical protein